MTESWFVAAKSQVYQKNKAEVVLPTTFNKKYDDVFQELIKASPDYKPQYPPTADSINNETFLKNLLEEIKKMIYGSNDFKSFDVIKNKEQILNLENVVYCTDPSLKHLVYNVYNDILNSNIANKDVLTKIMSLEIILVKLINCPSNSPLEEILFKIACNTSLFDVSQKEVMNIISTLAKKEIDVNKKPLLLKILAQACDKSDADSFFHFLGTPGSGITIPLLPEINKNMEYTIMSWFNIRDYNMELLKRDPGRKKLTPEWNPYLFSFSTEDGIHIAVYFSLDFITFEVNNGTKQQIFQFAFNMTYNEWHQIFITHRFLKNDCKLTIYMDGNEIGYCDASFPSILKTRFTRCFIGKSSRNTQANQFIGSISGFYIWSIAIPHDKIRNMYSLTHTHSILYNDLIEYFGFDLSQGILDLFDGSLTYSLACVFFPNSTIDGVCLDASSIYHQVTKESYNGTHSNDVLVIRTKNIRDILTVTGDLCPFYAIVHYILDSSYTQEQYSIILISIMELISKLVCTSTFFKKLNEINKGFRYIAWKVFESKLDVYTKDFIDCILRSSKILVEKREDIINFKDLLFGFIFDTKIWIKWPYEALTHALNFMIVERVAGQDYALFLKKSIGVKPITDIILSFYNDDSIQNDPNAMTLKTYLLSLIKQIIIQGSGIQSSELDSALYYFGPKKEDYIEFLVKTMKEAALKNKQTFGTAFCNFNSILVFDELLSSKDPNLFNEGMEFFTLAVNNAPKEPLRKLVCTYHIWSILTYHLLERPLSEDIYKYLLRMLIGDFSYEQLVKDEQNFAKTAIIKHARVIQVISMLIQSELLKSKDDQARKDQLYLLAKNFLSLLEKVLKTNVTNRTYVLSKSGWQGWILGLLRLFINHPDYKEVERTIFSIASMVCIKGIFLVKDGWLQFLEFITYSKFYSSEYLHFDTVTSLLTTEYSKTPEVVKQIITSPQDNKQDVNTALNVLVQGSLGENRYHKLAKDIPAFDFNEFSCSLFAYFLTGLVDEMRLIENISHTIKDPSSFVFLDNLSQIVNYCSDVVINSFGNISTLLSLALLSESSSGESVDAEGLPSNSKKYFLFSNMIENVYTILELIFVSSGLGYKEMEELFGLSQCAMLHLSFRVGICKVLNDVCVNNFRYWKMIASTHSIHATPLHNMKESVRSYFDAQIAYVEKNSKELGHPLLKKLITPNTYKYFKDIFSRRVEYLDKQHIVSGALVYALSNVAITHYKRIIDYKPPDNVGNAYNIFRDMDLKYFIDTSLSNLLTLLYEIMVLHSDAFNKTLLGTTGNSLMDISFKYMKTTFKPIEFVMMLASENWRRAIEKSHRLHFEILVADGQVFSQEAMSMFGKQCCVAADLNLYSAIFVQKSVYSTSSWKRSLLKLNNIIQSQTVEIKEKAQKPQAYSNSDLVIYKLAEKSILLADVWLFKSVSRLNRTNNTLCLIDCEDHLRRRLYVIYDSFENRVYDSVTFLKEGQRFSDIVVLKDPMETLRPADYQEVITVSSSTQSEANTSASNLAPDSGSVSTKTSAKAGELLKNVFTKLKSVQINFHLPKKEQEVEAVTFACKWITPGLVVPGQLIINVSSGKIRFNKDESYLQGRFEELSVRLRISCPKFYFNVISRVFLRKYTHLPHAVEIFTDVRKTFFFVFSSEDEAKHVISALPEVGIGADFGLQPHRSVSMLPPSVIFEKSTIPQAWCNHAITNFEYLMFLNTISGRTYQDISQYPVFPWILNNYDTETIDLTDPKNYRDLTKPIGALNVERLAQSVAHFMTDNRCDPGRRCHYETHYSTPDIVTDYLVRLEPFSYLRPYIYGNRLENPSDSFNSMSGMWKRITSNSSDIRELTPEFYYLPEMFTSYQAYYSLNEDKKCVELKNVELPPYAKDAQVFVNILAEALESSFVSSTLHKWIDLVFGFQQRGREAEKVINIFNYLTYENPIANLNIENQEVKDSFARYICLSGQSPAQLSIKPHPSKVDNNRDMAIRYSDSDKYVNMFGITQIHTDAPILYIGLLHHPLVTRCVFISSSLKLIVKIMLVKTENDLPTVNFYPPAVNLSSALSLSTDDQQDLNFHFDVPEMVHNRCTPFSFSTTLSPKSLLAACPYWDKSFRVYNVQTRTLTQVVHMNQECVTCVDCDYDFSSRDTVLVVTGSRDATICLWAYSNVCDCVTSVKNWFTEAQFSPVVYMYGHDSPVIQVSLKTGAGMIASSSQSGTICIHSINSRLISSFKPCEEAPDMVIIKILLLFNGNLLVLNSNQKSSILKLYDRYGKILNQKNIPEGLNCMGLDFTEKYCFVSGTSNTLVAIKTGTFDVVYSYSPAKYRITYIKSIDIDTIIVGMTSGEVGLLSTKGFFR